MKVWKKSLLMLLALIVLIVGTVAGYALTIRDTTVGALKSTYIDTGSNNAEIIKATKPLTILLMGVDTRGGADAWAGNSDSQIVMTLNPQTDTTTMVSMERDTMVHILDGSGQDTGTVEKLNAAYPLGYNSGGLTSAAAWSEATISLQAGIKIDNFAAMNFDGIVSLVNAVGGIDIDNTSGTTLYISDTEPAYTAKVPPGKQHINGDQALVYARDRHHMANGDYGRAAHQREVLTQLVKKMLSLNNISQYQSFLQKVSKDFKTSIPLTSSTLPSLLGYRDCFKKVVSIQYEGVGDMYQGVSYQFTPNAEYLAVQNAMRKSLGQATSATVDSNLISYENRYGTTPSYLLPSATVTENGKKTVYGVDEQGSFVSLNATNSANYVSTNGDSVSADSSTSSSSASTSTATVTSSVPQ
ncbi:MAG: LCP family protein [Streptococcaceae bacterium]|jgi:LCP family protein required for cell wall assembly|nr:LCP family protein [Streptococcaceae bacterium]